MQVDCVKYGRVASVVQHHRALFHHLGYNFNIIVPKLLFAVLFVPVLFPHVLPWSSCCTMNAVHSSGLAIRSCKINAAGTLHFLQLDDYTIMSFLVYYILV